MPICEQISRARWLTHSAGDAVVVVVGTAVVGAAVVGAVVVEDTVSAVVSFAGTSTAVVVAGAVDVVVAAVGVGQHDGSAKNLRVGGARCAGKASFVSKAQRPNIAFGFENETRISSARVPLA